MTGSWFKDSRLVSLAFLVLILLVAVACGSAAQPEATTPEAAAPASEVTAGSVPTAVPQVQAEPAAATGAVNEGTLNVMVGDLASERFDIAYVGGSPGGANYGRILHGFLISMTPQTEMIPGIAEAGAFGRRFDDHLHNTGGGQVPRRFRH